MTVNGPNSIRQLDRLMPYNETKDTWDSMPDRRRSRAMKWVNRWRALNGGFQLLQDDGQMIVEPARMRDIAPHYRK